MFLEAVGEAIDLAHARIDQVDENIVKTRLHDITVHAAKRLHTAPAML